MTEKIKDTTEAAKDRLQDVARGREDIPAPMRALRNAGFTSDIAYALGLGSVFVAMIAWFFGRSEAAHQRGIFIGLWAPTFMALGKALEGQ
jgi:hypothetical protein